jgi:predicted nucleic acid-binding protein
LGGVGSGVARVDVRTLVLDANVALAAAAHPRGFRLFRRTELVAPPLLWSEARSVLHVGVWRGLVSSELALASLTELESGAVKEHRSKKIGRETWAIAEELRWAKTYDAEYLAVARLLGAELATLDVRMQRAGEQIQVAIADLSVLR